MKYLAVLLASGALGCLDFDLVAPVVVAPAVGISVLVTHDSASSYALSVQLRSGNDARGRTNGLSDTTVYVNDEPVQSDIRFGFRGGNRIYEWERTRPSSVNADSLRLQLPVFAAGSSNSFKVTVPTAARTDPFDLTLNAGDDLRLHVTPTLEPIGFSRPVEGFWQLVLRESCEGGEGIQVRGNGTIPSELRVPWDWLQTSASPLMACLQTFSSLRNDGTPYETFVSVALRVNWRITITGR